MTKQKTSYLIDWLIDGLLQKHLTDRNSNTTDTACVLVNFFATPGEFLAQSFERPIHINSGINFECQVRENGLSYIANQRGPGSLGPPPTCFISCSPLTHPEIPPTYDRYKKGNLIVMKVLGGDFVILFEVGISRNSSAIYR